MPYLHNKDVKLNGHLLIISIDNEFLKGVYFNSSGFSKTQFEVIAFIQPLFVPSSTIFFTFGTTLKSLSGDQWWKYAPENLKQQGLDLANRINEIDERFFKKIKDSKDFYNHYKSTKRTTLSHFESTTYSACFARLPESRKELDEFIRFIEKSQNLNIGWVRDIYEKTILLKSLIENLDETQSLFNLWKSETLQRISLAN